MRVTFIWVIFACVFIAGCGRENESSQNPSDQPPAPSVDSNDVRQPDPWDNPAEFSVWVNNRMRVINGSPPLRPDQRPRSLEDIVNQPDQKKAVAELQGRVDDAFKEVFADGNSKLERIYNLVNTILKQAEAGGQSEAVENVRKLLRRFEGANNYNKSTGQEEAVYALVILGEFKQAQEVAAKIEVHYMKRRALQFTAKILIANGNKEQAIVVLKQALEIARAINEENGGTRWEPTRFGALCRIAEWLADAGDMDAAVTILNEAKAMLPSLESAQRANLYLPSYHCAIAETQFAMGNKEEALASLKKAVEVVRTIENPLFQSSRLDYPASLFAKFGEKGLSSKTFDRAFLVAKKIEDPNEPNRRANRIGNLADSAVKAGAFKKAVTFAKAIEDVEGHHPPKGIRFFAFQEIAHGLAFESVPNKYKLSRNARPIPINRLKKAFTPEEQQIAKEIVEAMKK